jgi:hypothetical protein
MGNTDNIVVANYWRTKEYSDLGLLDIVTLDNDVVAEDIESSIAEHLVKMHNAWWDARVWRSYFGNIAYSIFNDAYDEYYSVEKPLTEDEFFDYDDEHETT